MTDLVLDVDAARPAQPHEWPQWTLALRAGDFALIDARETERAGTFADLACGLVACESGAVRFIGRDWAGLPPVHAAAMRGRIGRVFARGGWIDFMDTAANILLPMLHHTRTDEAVLRERATDIARRFGLPGQLGFQVDELSPADLARATCVRALLGDPLLLLLEMPVQGRDIDLLPPLLNATGEVRGRGGAVVWFTRSDAVWADPAFPATHRLRLTDRGLFQAQAPRMPRRMVA
jgi:phospholipid/cholesterol/gamma-HCH transport system ATP-binding protein